MLIKVGCEIEFTYPNPTVICLMLYLHPSVTVRIDGRPRCPPTMGAGAKLTPVSGDGGTSQKVALP